MNCKFKFKCLKILTVGFIFLLFISMKPDCIYAEGESRLVSKVDVTDKVIALTFDDGSDGNNISEVLKILKENDVKSTFFITGASAKKHTDLIKEIVQEGHEIGNHSYSHPDFTLLTEDEIKNELEKTDELIKNITGISTKPYFRPPYGAFNEKVLKSLGNFGYAYTIYWTIDTVDWTGNSENEITKKVLDKAAPGYIVLMHVGAGADNTSKALPVIIKKLKEKGYSFVTIKELLNNNSTFKNQYIVKPGDTLWRISKMYGLTVQKLAEINNISNVNMIYAGQVLNVYNNQSTVTGISNIIKYTVQPGDTLWKISLKFGVTVQQIAEKNNIINVNLIYPNEVIEIK